MTMDDACGAGGCGGWFACNPGEPWKLPQPCFLQQHKTVLGGWLEQGITFNDQDSDGFNGPVATNDMAGEYQMNQMWMYLHRPADTGGCGFAWGGHIDMIYGTDWRFGINHGLEDRINGFDYQSYGLVIPQAYLELAYNDLSVKLGHFAAILDYEAVPGRDESVLLALVQLRLHGAAAGDGGLGRLEDDRPVLRPGRFSSRPGDVRGFQRRTGSHGGREMGQLRQGDVDRLRHVVRRRP